MESFYKNGKSIIGFCVLTLLFNMIFDEKSTEKFVLLVLFSMCILNADKVTEWMETAFQSGGAGEHETANETLHGGGGGAR